MNAWLLRAQWWRIGLLMAAVIAPIFVVINRLVAHQSWPIAVIGGLVAAALCGPVLGYFSKSQTEQSLAASGLLQSDDLARVERATRRGPVPDDDALRGAALRVVEDRQLVLRGLRTRALLSTSAVGLVGLVVAVTLSPVGWLLAGAGVAGLALVVAAPLLLSQRAALLRRAGS